jgi:hypothetical protein
MERQPPLSQGSILFNPTATPPARPTPQPNGAADMDATLYHVVQALQLSRASTLALMRMQLAVRSGERLQAMAAMDRLDALDSELERVLTCLPAPGPNDPAAQLIAKHIEDQKLALAFEKLALASGIVGPDMVSIEDALPDEAQPPADPAAWEPPAQAPDMPELTALRPVDDFAPERARGISSTAIGLILTLLIAAGIAAAAWAYL